MLTICRWTLFALLVLAVLPCAVIDVRAESAAAGRRVALVVGNTDYASVPDLKNAANDASAIAASLTGLGFDVVEKTDVGFDAFAGALYSFYKEAQGAEVALVFYSGHGFQFHGRNYLVPTDATLREPDRMEHETFLLDEIAGEVQRRSKLTMIFIDACRSNPLPPDQVSKNQNNGLAPLQTEGGTFVAFATQPGNISLDGEGDHSPFTEALLEHLPTRGISIFDMMIRVRNSVEDATNQKQVPWEQSSLRSQFYFNPLEDAASDGEEVAALGPSDGQDETVAGEDGAVVARLIILPVGIERGKLAAGFQETASIEPKPVVPSISIEPGDESEEVAALTNTDEAAYWESISGSTDPADFRRYLEAYPNGSFARVAELNVKALEKLGETETRLKEFEIAQKAASGSSDALNLEELYWGTIRESDLPGDFEAYMRAFPGGAFADLAQARIESLSRAQEISGATDASSATRSQLRAAAMQQSEKIPTQFLQYGLIALGYPLPLVSGVIDGETRKSIRAYQASVNDAQTGKLTAQQAVDLLLAAATVGDEHAQTAVGIMMASGQGLQRDYAFARLWLKHAAEQGNPYAQANLAILHRDGLGGKKDIAAARELLGKAAEGGVAEAAEALKNLKG